MCSVSFCVTLSIACTRVVHQAGVGTHTVVTCLVVVTVRVLLASYREAADVRISLESNLACADWMTVNNTTVSIWSTVTRYAAHAVDTGLLYRTVRVGTAARWDGDLN